MAKGKKNAVKKVSNQFAWAHGKFGDVTDSRLDFWGPFPSIEDAEQDILYMAMRGELDHGDPVVILQLVKEVTVNIVENDPTYSLS